MSTDEVKLQSETIDRLRPLLALMVVGLHVRPYYITGTETFFDGLYEASVITIYRVFFSIAVPFFFLISGYYFFKGLDKWDATIWKDKIKKRIGSLLVPYLLWNVIAFAGYFVTRFSGHIIKGAPMPNILAELGERGWLRIFWDRCLYGEIRTAKMNLFGFAVSTSTPMNEPTWFLRDLMVVILFTPLMVLSMPVFTFDIISIASTSWSSGFSFGDSIGQGTNSMMSRFLGTGDYESAYNTLIHG